MILLVNNVTGEYKQVKKGFSWTMLFFGVFVPLLRGDWKWFLITFALALLTSGASWFVFPFFYNHLYIDDLLKKGYSYPTSNSSSVNVHINS